MNELATIGYQGASLENFVAALRAAGIAVLIDVRWVPWSRRPEFRKEALAKTLGDAGIAYVHLKGLGNPSIGREAAEAGDRQAYPRTYLDHLNSGAAQADLARAAELARKGGACLMCLEKDPNHCHRRYVAAALETLAPFTVRHLFVEPPTAQPRLL